MAEILRLGIPKGSLNDREDHPDQRTRGNTRSVFYKAGYDIRDYEPGKEGKPSINNKPDADEISLELIRPQNGYSLLVREMLDAAIMGNDSFQEGTTNYGSQPIEKIGDLGYGKTRFVLAVPINEPYGDLSGFFSSLRGAHILCYTEYPAVTGRAFVENPVYQKFYGQSSPVIDINGLRWGKNHRVEIVYSAGATEALIGLGANIITEITQSGRTLEYYHLKIIGTILESCAGLYIGPSCIGWKREKVQELFERLSQDIKSH